MTVDIGEDLAVVEGLQDVVVAGAFVGVEELLDGLGAVGLAAGLVIDNADAVALGRVEQVETVDDATHQPTRWAIVLFQ